MSARTWGFKSPLAHAKSAGQRHRRDPEKALLYRISTEQFALGGPICARGAKVIDLRKRRIDRLATELAPVLLSAGYIVAELNDIDSVDEWRAAARAVGRRDGTKIRTGFSRSSPRIWAAFDDDA